MDSWIHHGFLDAEWILGFAMDFGIGISGFMIDYWIHDGFLDARRIIEFKMIF